MVARNTPAASLLRHLHGLPLGWLPPVLQVWLNRVHQVLLQ